MVRILKVALIVLILLVCAAGAGAWWITHPGRGPRETVNANEKGYVEQIEGTTVLHLKGSPYEMGYQHGVLARDKIHQVVSGFDELLDEAKHEVGLPKFAAEFILDGVYRLCSPHIPDRYKREMEGLADGAGVSLRTLRRMQVIGEVTERGCSVFAVFGKATVDGKVYHGRNFDWMMEAGMQDAAALLLYEPDGLAPFASAGYLGSVGVLSGMNMDGIAIGQIGAVTRDQRFAGIPLMLLMRRVLEEAHDMNQATEIFTTAQRTVGYNYVVCDAKAQEARAYETCARHCAVFTDNDPKEVVEYAIPIDDAVFRADEAMDATVRSFQRCSKGYPNLPYGSESYEHRYKGMATMIKANYGKIDQKTALEILKAAAMRNTNLHSVLCNVSDKEIWVAHAKGQEDAWKQPYVRYDLKKLFLRPEQRAN